jgi:hypothetical protein
MQLTDRLSPSATKTFVEALPSNIGEALAGYAKETEYPIESVVEMAIAFFLDVDCAGFADCRTGPDPIAARNFGNPNSERGLRGSRA